MIGYLCGKVLRVVDDSFLLEVSGVGYELYASGGWLSDLQIRKGQQIEAWVYTHVREDVIQLFGFPNPEEKEFFLSLLKVNGVGPRSALAALSGAHFHHIQEWIEGGNAQALAKLPKVGKKTAEQMILTLQGKLVRVQNRQALLNGDQKQIQTALVNLGFKEQKVEEFIGSLPMEITVEEGVRRGLVALSNV